MGEYENLVNRGFKSYTEGHCRMYSAVAEMLGFCEGVKKRATIFEVGFGIGYGLSVLLKSDAVEKYVGCEPDKACVDYVASLITEHDGSSDSRVRLINKSWDAIDYQDVYDFLGGGPDFVLCIEVIEHLPPADRPNLIKKLSRILHPYRTMFLSTPSRITCPQHGVLSPHECRQMILDNGFSNVAYVEWQWTTLYVCNVSDTI